MSFEVEAIYEDGILKPEHPLPLSQHQRVKITVEEQPSVARRSYGIIGWKGDPEVLRKMALDDEFGIQDSP